MMHFLPHLVESYKSINNFDLINELTQFTFLEKRKVTNIIPYDELGKINNYMVFLDGKQRINNIFNAN